MWTNENRHRYDRGKLRYPSGLTDAEWSQIECLIPPAKRGGNKRTVVMREVVNGLIPEPISDDSYQDHEGVTQNTFPDAEHF